MLLCKQYTQYRLLCSLCLSQDLVLLPPLVFLFIFFNTTSLPFLPFTQLRHLSQPEAICLVPRPPPPRSAFDAIHRPEAWGGGLVFGIILIMETHRPSPFPRPIRPSFLILNFFLCPPTPVERPSSSSRCHRSPVIPLLRPTPDSPTPSVPPPAAHVSK